MMDETNTALSGEPNGEVAPVAPAEPIITPPTETPAVEPAPVTAPAEPTPDLPYTISEWNHLPNYGCRVCPFDTLDLDVMVHHIVEAHRGPSAAVIVSGQLVDRFGNPIRQEG